MITRFPTSSKPTCGQIWEYLSNDLKVKILMYQVKKVNRLISIENTYFMLAMWVPFQSLQRLLDVSYFYCNNQRSSDKHRILEYKLLLIVHNLHAASRELQAWNEAFFDHLKIHILNSMYGDFKKT